MKIVVIYGPPGVGKLTVGVLVAKKTRFKLIHTHQLADTILSLFPFGAKEFQPLLERTRMEFVKAAVKSRRVRGLVLTGLYSPNFDIDFTDRFIRWLSRMPCVRLFFVRLACRREELYRRIRLPSRRAFQKTSEKGVVEYLLKRYRVDGPMKGRKGLEFDNTRLSAEECARRIKQSFLL